LLAALVLSAVMVLDAIVGANDEQLISLRVVWRIARRQGLAGRDRCAGNHLP
jgi:hypothetical protein